MKTIKNYKKFNENVQDEDQDENEDVQDENVQHYENVKSEVEEWLTDNGFDYNIELDINAPCIIVNIKKTSNGFSSEDLDAHYSGAILRPKNSGIAKGGLLGDYTLLEEAYDQLAVVQSISNSIEDFGLRENRIYFLGEYIVYDFSFEY
jgi:hypothetical protein